jgi:hypothetical protein
MIKIREDDQSKSMSTFDKVEHLRPNRTRMMLLEQNFFIASRYLHPNHTGDPFSPVGKGTKKS